MNVLVNTSTRFFATPDGQFWAPAESLAYAYWTRYLDAFDEVLVLARAVTIDQPPSSARPASGQCVKVIPLPNYCGIRQFARDYFPLRKQVRDSLCLADTVCLALPCVIGDLVWRSLGTARPFGVVVCGDPHDALAPGTVRHPLRTVLRWWFSRQLRLECEQACACAYVTKHALQSRYPSREDAFSTYFSNVNLCPDVVVDTPRKPVKRGGPFHIITVGTFDTWYKGPDILLEAFGSCIGHGADLKLTFVGDGRYRRKAERLAEELAVATRVQFAGQLHSSAAVRSELDTADLFVLPSRAEGLPKAMVEAMARALPCIGTTVGGTPELLPKEDLVPPNDPLALGRRIEEVLRDPQRMARMSARNLRTSQEYRSSVLRQRRIEFYRFLRGQTVEWLKIRQSSLSPQTSACA